MSGNPTGGKLAAETNKNRYGQNFYKRIGALGGKKSTGGGFAASQERAVEAGRKGAKIRWAKYYAEKGEN
jgi:general stress protein YciG